MSNFEHSTDSIEPIEETVGRLSEIVGETNISKSEQSGGTVTDDAPANAEALNTSVTELLERADGAVESLLVAFSRGAVENALDDFNDLRGVIEETVELLETVDLTEVASAIDYDNIDEAIDPSSITDALSEGDVDEAIRYSKLLMLIEFDELLSTVDIRDFRQNKDELEAAVNEFVDDRNEDSGWIVFDALKWIVDTIVSDNGESEGVVDSMDVDVSDATEIASGGQMKQVAMQSKLRDAVEEFREGLFEAHERMKTMREQASEEMPETAGGTEQPSSRNPTAYSTMPPRRSHLRTQFSTVPKDSLYSNVSNPPRVYGSRFDTLRDDDE
ncbi:hypothetical protein [Halocatena marina]|uniref:hypothetical protein n=1 Tax=Halocatena marina TaxID=2934937 RepID=UPI00200C6F78|nr:hypothetical protein [Halocatena marina]